MSGARLAIDVFAPDDERMAGFEAVRASLPYPAAPPEPVPSGAQCVLARRDGQSVARLSRQLVANMHGAPGLSGLVGHYEALDAAAGVALLRHAKETLRWAGAERVLGPMNGSTWARYRLALPAGPGDRSFDPPVFLTEPQNPPGYAGHFEAAGFRVAARYESRIVIDLSEPRTDAAALGARVRAQGITVRPLDLARWEIDLVDLFEFCRSAFADNPYYTPIPFAAFRAMYGRIRPLLDPDLVRLARNAAGRLIGFVFALPDAPSAGRRVVLKTLASAPEARGLGLARHLTDEATRLAHQKGADAVIHALMHVTNASVRISTGRFASHVFRRYALYEWMPGSPAA